MLVAGGIAATCLGCDLGYGADFDYPDRPPHPPGTSVVAEAKAFDDDNPIRGRLLVLSLDDATRDDVLAFYRSRSGADQGWQPGSADPDDQDPDRLLCLARSVLGHHYDEYLEVDPDHDSADPRRLVVRSSRQESLTGRHWGELERCGVAAGYFADPS